MWWSTMGWIALPTTPASKSMHSMALPVYSARYGGTHGDAEDNMTKLLAGLERVGATTEEARAAQFRTVICLIQEGEEHLIEGQYEGSEPVRSGADGFGYDPFSNQKATPSHLQKWPLKRKLRSATGAARSARWWSGC